MPGLTSSSMSQYSWLSLNIKFNQSSLVVVVVTWLMELLDLVERGELVDTGVLIILAIFAEHANATQRH